MKLSLARYWRAPPAPDLNERHDALCWIKQLIKPHHRAQLRDLSERLGYRSGYPITICIDGVTWGGAGKTQVVEYLARSWAQLGAHVAVLGHGYRAQRAWSHPIELPNTLSYGDLSFGDEAAMLRLALPPSCQVWVGGDWSSRWRVASDQGVDLIICDGGLYHQNLPRALGVVVAPFNLAPRLVPWGDLTRPITSCPHGRGHLYWWVDHRLRAHEETPSPRDLSKFPFQTQDSIAVISHLDADRWVNCFDEELPIDTRWEHAISAISAIARPQRFLHVLQDLGLDVSEHITLRDHASISPLIQSRLERGDWLTTMKDLVKLPLTRREIWALRVQITPPFDSRSRE